MVQKVFIHRVNKTLRVRPNAENPATGETLLGTIDHDVGGNTDAVGFKGSHVLFQDVENLCIRKGIELIDYAQYKIIGYKVVTGVNAGADFTVTVAGGANHTKQLAPVIIPADTTEVKTFSYVSSDPTKATVSAGGLVTGVAVGSTVITVTTTSGAKTDAVTVMVTA